MNDRYVVLGLAVARSPWFRSVAAWANSGAAPIEFVKCVSAVELRAHLAGARRFSAVIVDAAANGGIDRDLIDAATQAGAAVIVVQDLRVDRDWPAIGAAAVVNPVFERDDLVAVLREHATPIARADAIPGRIDLTAIEHDDAAAPPTPALLVAVCGPGGTGASTAAIALAQGLADDVRHGGLVTLVDLARNGEQAMLHDARELVPAIQELVALHRSARPSIDEVRATAFHVPDRGYNVVLGLRRRGGWAAIRPRAFTAALDSLRDSWRAVVCDVDGDFESEQDGGSADVEERNLMARTAVTEADVVLVVGNPGMKGTHALARTITDAVDAGVDPARILPVVSRAPRAPRHRAELAGAIAALVDGKASAMPSPVFLPDRRVDDALRDGVRLPEPLPSLLAGAVAAVAGRSDLKAARLPVPIAPGSLGAWSPSLESA